MGSNSDKYRCDSDSLDVYGILMIKNIIPEVEVDESAIECDNMDISSDQIILPEWRLPYAFRGGATWIVGAEAYGQAEERPTPPENFDFQGDYKDILADDGQELERESNNVNVKVNAGDDDDDLSCKMAAMVGALMQDHPWKSSMGAGVWDSNSLVVLTKPEACAEEVVLDDRPRGAANSSIAATTTHGEIVEAGEVWPMAAAADDSGGMEAADHGGGRVEKEKTKKLGWRKKKKKKILKKTKRGLRHGDLEDEDQEEEEEEEEVLVVQKIKEEKENDEKKEELGDGMSRRRRRISHDPQSVIARQRRQRIGDRIRVLQRLVPDAAKLDTASMLDKAARYLKYLQSQLLLRRQQHQHHHLLHPNPNPNPNPNPPPNHDYHSYSYHHYHDHIHDDNALLHNPLPPFNYNTYPYYYPSPYPHPNPPHAFLLNNPTLSYPPFLFAMNP